MKRAAAVGLVLMLLCICVNGCAESKKNDNQTLYIFMALAVASVFIIPACVTASEKKHGASPEKNSESVNAKYKPVKTKILLVHDDNPPGGLTSVTKGVVLGGFYDGLPGAITGAVIVKRNARKYGKTTFKVWVRGRTHEG